MSPATDFIEECAYCGQRAVATFGERGPAVCEVHARQTRRYVASVNVAVEACDGDEAALIVERALAGLAEHSIIQVFEVPKR